MGIMLAMIGLGLMVGLSGAGSAVGLVISGQALMGMIRKRPEAYGVGLGMASPPATQGLYGFVGYILYSQVITGKLTAFQGAVILGAGIAVGVACLISAIYQGKVCASGLAAYGSGHNVIGQTFVLAAFPEFYAILSLITAILMMQILRL
jgi:V/A-type H+-transporting ATPase subunit K